MYSNDIRFNLENFSLFFLYIKKFHMFEDVLIRLDPRYRLSKHGEVFEAILDPSYLDLTTEIGLNIIVLCGRNGIGKTTILRILQGAILADDEDYTIVWRDDAGNLLSTNKAQISIDGELHEVNKWHDIDSIRALCANQSIDNSDGFNSLERHIVSVYAKNSELYDQGSSALFDGFYVGYKKESFLIDDLGEDLAKRLRFEDWLGFRGIAERSPVFHAWAHAAQDNSFDGQLRATGIKVSSFDELQKALESDLTRELDKKILDMIYEDGNPPDVFERDGKRKYKFSQYDEVYRKINDYSEQIDKWLKRLSSQLHIEKGNLDDLLWLHPFKTFGNKIAELEDFSFGQRLKLRFQFNLTPFLFQDQVAWFFFDEWDSDLHPEWKRRVIADLVGTFKISAKTVYKAKRKPRGWKRLMTCIMVTHSPFILSDMMSQNVVLFREGKNGRTVVQEGSESFAGNIGELFHTEFFMDTTIGEFARSNISKALRQIEKGVTSEKREACRKLFEKVGDQVLRNLLLERLENESH